jgi:hypothetical protein
MMSLTETQPYGKSAQNSDSRFFWVHVEIPVDTAVLAIALHKPLIAFGEVVAIKLARISIVTLPRL